MKIITTANKILDYLYEVLPTQAEYESRWRQNFNKYKLKSLGTKLDIEHSFTSHKTPDCKQSREPQKNCQISSRQYLVEDKETVHSA